MKRFLLFVMFCLPLYMWGQQVSPFAKFGKISVQDLQKKAYPIDSNANAVVLSDIGHVSIDGNNKGWFSIIFTRHKVIHILNKSGYPNADFSIRLFRNEKDQETLETIKGVTYNLVDGKITETKLDKGSIFTNKIDKNWVEKRFSLSDVREGSIVEVEYKITSDFIRHIEPWDFQGRAPRLWSEFVFSAPSFFTYTYLSHGYNKMYLNDRKDKFVNFSVTISKSNGLSMIPENYNFNAGVTDYRWVMKDVPELKEESFTSTLTNHVSSIQLQLASQGAPLEPHNFIESWPDLTAELIQSEYFGKNLAEVETWVPDDARPILVASVPEEEKAKTIFAYVRDKYACTGNKGIYTDQSFKNLVKTKTGTVSEINLLLVGLLRYAGLQAHPIILSTTDNGYVYEKYASLTQFNYVICEALVNNKKVYLDASSGFLGYNKLHAFCYNGHARVVDEDATPVLLSSDLLKEQNLTSLFILNDDKDGWVGTVKQTLSYEESYRLRRNLKQKGKEEYLKDLQKNFGNEVKVKDLLIDSLASLENPVAMQYSVAAAAGTDDLLYINPMFGFQQKTNPFKSEWRVYPVEMPYASDETFVLTMQVPKGYEVDELPKQIKAKMDDVESAYFEYLLTASGSTISLRTRIKFNRTLFQPSEYEVLRNFFNLIVTKQNEQIVFKKKK